MMKISVRSLNPPLQQPLLLLIVCCVLTIIIATTTSPWLNIVKAASTARDATIIGNYIYPKPTGDFFPPSFNIKDDSHVKQACFYLTKLDKDDSKGVLTGIDITFHSGETKSFGTTPKTSPTQKYKSFLIEYFGMNAEQLSTKTTAEGEGECVDFEKYEKIKLWRNLITPTKKFFQLISSTIKTKSKIGDINKEITNNLHDPRFKQTINGKESVVGIDFFKPEGAYLVGFQGHVVEGNYITAFAPIFKFTEPQLGKKFFYGEFSGNPEKQTISIFDEKRSVTRICCSKYKDSIRKNSIVGLYVSSVARDLTSDSLQFNTQCIDYSENEPIAWRAQTYSYTDREGLFVGSLTVETQISQKKLECKAPGFSDSTGTITSTVDDSGVLVGVYKSSEGEDITSLGPIWKKKIEAYILLSYDLDTTSVIESASSQRSVATQTLINKSSVDQTMSIEGEYEATHTTTIEDGQSDVDTNGLDLTFGTNIGGSFATKAGVKAGGAYLNTGIKTSLDLSFEQTLKSSSAVTKAWLNSKSTTETKVFKYNFPIVVGANKQVTARVIYTESVGSMKWKGKASIVYQDSSFDIVDLEGFLTSVTKSNVLASIDQDVSISSTTNSIVSKTTIDSSMIMPELSRLQSISGIYYMTLNEEGSLVVFQTTTSGNIQLWKSNQMAEQFVDATGASGPYTFQVRDTDGALVVKYGSSTYWAVNTGRTKAVYSYSLLDNGNLVQYDSSKSIIWSLQDNNLFDAKVLPSGTTMKQGQILYLKEKGREFLLELQKNGVLRLMRDGVSVWDSGNTPNSLNTYSLQLNKDGVLKILTSSGISVKDMKASGSYTGTFTLILDYNALYIKNKDKIIHTLWNEISGEQVFSAKDSEQTFKVPDNVRFISVLCVGGGQAGKEGIGGGGGALSYCNNIPVTPGQTIALRAGVGEKTTGTQNSDTFVSNFCKVTKNSLRGKGGIVVNTNGCPGTFGSQYGLNTTTIDGAGAAGYSSKSGGSNGYYGGGGGGVGLYGETNGSWVYKMTAMIQGAGGSGGEGGKVDVKDGARYGGGGGVEGSGGDGVVRIIWGDGRNFPFNAQQLF